MKILLTGTAGFIGYHTAEFLLKEGHEVVGFDSINDYYDISVKYGRLERHGISTDGLDEGSTVQSNKYNNYRFIKGNLENKDLIQKVCAEEKFDAICNLAAQAGVRYSLVNPHAYISSNIEGFLNILEAARHNEIGHVAYASSSSVYGLNETLPFSTSDNIDHPVSLYAASKKSNELMAHTYSHLFRLPTTGLRFFTVYGPWGRPDMALFIFTKAILEGTPIKVFNHGDMIRDFTYIDDIVTGIVRVIESPPKGNPEWSGKDPDPSCSVAPYKVYNIGNNSPVRLMDFIDAIEEKLGMKAEKEFLPLQPGDVPATSADVIDLERDMKYKPSTDIKTGISNFIDWYRDFYKV